MKKLIKTLVTVPQGTKTPKFGFELICRRDRGHGELPTICISRNIHDLPGEIKADREVPEPFVLVVVDLKVYVAVLENGFWTLDPEIDWTDLEYVYEPIEFREEVIFTKG